MIKFLLHTEFWPTKMSQRQTGLFVITGTSLTNPHICNKFVVAEIPCVDHWPLKIKGEIA